MRPGLDCLSCILLAIGDSWVSSLYLEYSGGKGQNYKQCSRYITVVGRMVTGLLSEDGIYEPSSDVSSLQTCDHSMKETNATGFKRSLDEDLVMQWQLVDL